MKKLLTIVLASVMALSLCACGSKTQPTTNEPTTSATTDRTTFIVGFDAEFPPYGYMNESGEYV